MQLTMIIASVVAAIPFVRAQTSTITTFTPQQSSKLVFDLVAYESSLAAQPAFSSVVSVLITGLPASVIQEMEESPSAYLEGFATATAFPSYIAALPSDVRSYLSSVGVAEASIISKDLPAAAAPTGRPAKLMGGMAAAGVVGMALW